MNRGFLQDVRYAIRVMVKTRVLTLVALVTLALGIGANTAIFTVVNALLLRPLPYSQPERLVMVWQDMRANGGPATEWTGPSEHFDWKAETAVFDGLTSLRGWSASLAGGALPEAFRGEQTTHEYFDVLGVRPALGRTFRDSDDVPGAHRVVILSHSIWTRRFGGDPSVIGRLVAINGGGSRGHRRNAGHLPARADRGRRDVAAAASEPDEPGTQRSGLPHDRTAEGGRVAGAGSKRASTGWRSGLQQTYPRVRSRHGHQSGAAAGAAGRRDETPRSSCCSARSDSCCSSPA